jgi:AhpD family alkylhydroperoxidase
MAMEPRLAYKTASPGVHKAMLQLHTDVEHCGLDVALLNLVYLRASQINGCAYCIDMHTKDARVQGETGQRLYLLSAWRKAPFYSDRERAALAWTEAVTRLERGEVPDETFQRARTQFTEKELADLTLAVVAINGWNRLNIAFRIPGGAYQPTPPRQPGGVPA